MQRSFALTGIALLAACSTSTRNPAPAEVPSPVTKTSTQAAPPVVQAPPEAAVPEALPPLWASEASLSAACAEWSHDVESLRQATLAGGGRAGAYDAFNRLLLTVGDGRGQTELLGAVHPSPEVRAAAERCARQLEAAYNQISLDPAIYRALESVDPETGPPGAKRFVEKVLLDLRLNGVDQPEAVRAQLKALDARMLEVGQTFGRNIREGTLEIRVKPERLAGLPDDFLASHPPEEDGLITLTTDYPDYFPIQTYATDGSLREELARAFASRAPANRAVLKELLELRETRAKALGYATWADYYTKDKMAGSAEAVRAMTDRVAQLARPRMKADLAELLALKRKDEPRARAIQAWDRFYYLEKLRQAKADVSSAEVRPYLAYPKVLGGVLRLYEDLFGLKIRELSDAPTWHPSVKAYALEQGGEVIGRFYLDMHPRPDKYSHAAMFPMQTGLEGGQLPEAALVCNFPDPSEGPALMEHQQVVTFFHELGHLVHHLLARGSIWANLAGINVEWDFVEAPSQLLEEWAWSPQVLARFAHHVESGDPIPAQLVERMRAANEIGRGVHVMRQIFYQALSLKLHDRPVSEVRFDPFVAALTRKYSPFPLMKGTHVYTSFGHLDGYSAGYYTYQWSLARAKDLFTRFETAGLMDRATAEAYRRQVLEPGGLRPAAELVETFLDRPFSYEAYEAWLRD